MKKLFLSLALVTGLNLAAQNNVSYWQQHVDYTMEIDMDVDNFQYVGTQELVYTNNSPDTLNKVFYHLYFNAFQPGSEMDVRSRTIEDPDRRVMDRISKLAPEDQGFIKVKSLTQDGRKISYQSIGTVLEVELNKPILPGEKTTFNMTWDAQVPEQVRRSGKESSEGVALSMTQWFPKLAEYDFQGWHAHPYIGREFHGVWGDFDVKITIDEDYTLGASGYLQNPEEVQHGYGSSNTKAKGDRNGKLTWHFVAPKVHDFAWAGDPEYIHDKITAKDGTVLHFLYKDNPEIAENWKNLQEKTEGLLLFFNEHIGPYPWDQYTVAQGGDGGMEYAMITLITGERSFGSLVGVTAHELAHAWFQQLLATNENLHEWMDEGFTGYISALAMDQVMDLNRDNPHAGSYNSYFRLAHSGMEQPQTTNADRFTYNSAYGASAYSKGAVFLEQLAYVIGEENLKETLKRYYNDWKFKHPTPNDFIRVAEKVSGAELGWYLVDWTQTTNQIDYGIVSVEAQGNNTEINLERKGEMPMPIEVNITYTDGSQELVYIPLRMMRWEKPAENDTPRLIQENWPWAYPTYTFSIDRPKESIKSIEIDASQRMADVNREDNLFEQ